MLLLLLQDQEPKVKLALQVHNQAKNGQIMMAPIHPGQNLWSQRFDHQDPKQKTQPATKGKKSDQTLSTCHVYSHKATVQVAEESKGFFINTGKVKK